MEGGRTLKIYLDVLLAVNCILTMIYLETLAKLVHRKTKPLRLFAASCTGGLFSLIMVMNGNTYFYAVIITLLKILGILLTLLICFRYKSLAQYLRYLAVYCLVRLVYTGVTLVYWQISDSKIIFVRNYTIYFNISLLKMVLAVITAYAVLTIYEKINRKRLDNAISYEAVYTSGNYELRIPAVADSGNRLCDSFTGMPVVIFYCNELYEHYNLSENYENLSGFRLCPYNTINGNGLLPITSKGKVTIIDEQQNKKEIKCYVGIAKSDNAKSRAIFNPILLQ